MTLRPPAPSERLFYFMTQHRGADSTLMMTMLGSRRLSHAPVGVVWVSLNLPGLSNGNNCGKNDMRA